MAKSYEQIQKQIAALQKEAESIRSKQVQSAIREIKEAIATYGLSAEDLGFTSTSKGRKRASSTVSKEPSADTPAKKVTRTAKKAAKKAAKTAAPKKATAKKASRQAAASKQDATAAQPKFSDGNGNVWSGRGPRPKWLKDFIAQGRTVEEFKV